MKKIFHTRLVSFFALIVALGFSFSLTSCDDDDYYWDVPSNGYIDRALVGTWELVQIDGMAVTGYDQNYFSFRSDGYGQYGYYYNGAPYTERINWWCEYGSGVNNWLMIQYPNQTAEQIYWLSDGGNSLWMQFTDASGRVITYRYAYMARAPW